MSGLPALLAPGPSLLSLRRLGSSSPLERILRVGAAACFVGHGAFGIITKSAWIPYFAVWGIPEPWAWRLMPVIGAVDISIGVLTLFCPLRAVLLYMACWGFQTACLRPLAGQGVWELFERAGNYGVPLALLFLLGWSPRPSEWVTPRPRLALSPERRRAIALTLRITTALLLIGHGGFGFAMGKSATQYFAAIGIPAGTVERWALTPAGGLLEAALGVAVLVAPRPGLLAFVFAWKLATEATRLLAGEPIWEFIERGGSYAAPLALLYVPPRRPVASTPRGAGSPAPASCTVAHRHGRQGGPEGRDPRGGASPARE